MYYLGTLNAFSTLFFFPSLRFLKSQRDPLDIYHIKGYAKLKQNRPHRFFKKLVSSCKNSEKLSKTYDILRILKIELSISFLFIHIFTPY